MRVLGGTANQQVGLHFVAVVAAERNVGGTAVGSRLNGRTDVRTEQALLSLRASQ